MSEWVRARLVESARGKDWWRQLEHSVCLCVCVCVCVCVGTLVEVHRHVSSFQLCVAFVGFGDLHVLFKPVLYAVINKIPA